MLPHDEKLLLPARGDIRAPSAAAPPSVVALAKQHFHRSEAI